LIAFTDENSKVSQRFSVSAAHCFDAFPNVDGSALLVGDHDTTTGADTKWSSAYALESYIKHPGYVAETSLNDMALVKTKFYVRFT
jgi:secreted trypsin-like serine protease